VPPLGPQLIWPSELVTMPHPATLTVNLKLGVEGLVPPVLDPLAHALAPVVGNLAVNVTLQERERGTVNGQSDPISGDPPAGGVDAPTGGITLSFTAKVYVPLPPGRVTVSAHGVIASQG
jgi:hypothetical protein